MPQYIEFKVTNLAFMKMGGGDPAKQIEERTKALDEIRKTAESGAYQYKAVHNPFPAWLQNIIKGLATSVNSKARFDDENAVYKIKVGGDRSDFDEIYNKFEAQILPIIAGDPEIQKWSDDNRINITSTPDDEMTAMNDLELYQRNAAVLPPGRTSSEGNK